MYWLLALTIAYVLASLLALAFSEQLLTVVTAIPARVFLFFILLVSVALALRTIRWCYIVRQTGLSVRWRDAAQIYVGGFPMALTPGRIGELWRAWVLASKWKIGYRRALPLVFCDRLLDLNVLLLFAAIGVFGPAVYHWPAITAVAFFLPLMLLLFKPRWCARLVKIGYAIFGKRLRRHFAALLTVCRHIALVIRPSLYLPAFALSLLAWSMEALAIAMAAASLGGTLSLHNAMATVGLGNIAGVLTFLPGGIGGQETAMIYLIQHNGNALPVAIAITGMARIGTIFFAALLGSPFFINLSRQHGKISLRKV